MKKTVYAIMILAAAVLAGCKKEVKTSGTGTLQMSLSAGGDYILATKATNSDVREFTVAIERPSDGWKREYPRYADMPASLELGSGAYTVTAASLYQEPAAFDQPIYSGTADFTITAGQMTPVSLTCTLANMKVTIVPTENFKKELSDYNVTICNDGAFSADHTLVWDKAGIDEGKAGYFSVAPLIVKVYGYRAIDNTEAHAELTVSKVAARDHHIIKLDAQVTGELGSLELIIDPSVNQKESDILIPGWSETPVERPDDPDPDDPPVGPVDPTTAPTMTWESNPDFEPMPITNEMDVNILIEAQEKIAGFIVSVDSPTLSNVIASMAGNTTYKYPDDGPYEMDLINDAAIMAVLSAVGVPTGDQLLGQTSVPFSISSLVPLILGYNPPSGSEHIFTLKVTDEKDQVLEKPIVFYID